MTANCLEHDGPLSGEEIKFLLVWLPIYWKNEWVYHQPMICWLPARPIDVSLLTGIINVDSHFMFYLTEFHFFSLYRIWVFHLKMHTFETPAKFNINRLSKGPRPFLFDKFHCDTPWSYFLNVSFYLFNICLKVFLSPYQQNKCITSRMAGTKEALKTKTWMSNNY